MRNRLYQSGMSLAEVLIALGVILVALLTLIAYVAMVHRAAREGKSQAVASIYARDMLERIRGSAALFEQASEVDGLQETRKEVLLEGEAEPSKNEVGRKSAMTYELVGRVHPTSTSIFRTVVSVSWQEQGRVREVVLESRSQQPTL